MNLLVFPNDVPIVIMITIASFVLISPSSHIWRIRSGVQCWYMNEIREIALGWLSAGLATKNRKYWIMMIARHEILIFRCLKSEHFDIYWSGHRKYWLSHWSGDQKYWFLLVRRRKIVVWSSLGTFQRVLGRLQKVLKGFWAENIDFSLVFEGFAGDPRLTGMVARLGWDP